MIRRISISNYALIHELSINPSSGFNIITGETGAGKSIILGALALLQGKRADVKTLSNPHEKLIVEAEVVLEDGSSRILRREILPSGRSKSMIDNEQVNLNELANISSSLIDIHSQNQNLQLTDPSFQLEIIDKLAHNKDLLDNYHRAFAEYRTSLQLFAKTRDEIERTRKDADYIEFQLKEFDNLSLESGEDNELNQIREKLEHTAEIVDSLSSAFNILDRNNDNSAVSLLYKAIDRIRSAVDLSNEYAPMLEKLEACVDCIENIADEIDDEVSGIGEDYNSLDEINRKIDRINSLKKKHHVSSVDELISIREELTLSIETLRNADATLHSLEQNARRLKKSALEIAAELSSRRKEAADILSRELMERARPLGMENLSFEINLAQGKLNPDGIDSIEFLFAFNKNQKPAPAVNRASGGELSRVMLALKSITVEHQNTPTIIFDEIDTGVSGDVANRMARLMALIGEHIQVITITHLPQVAARGDRHFKVYKQDNDTSTQTHIIEIDGDKRRAELALMLSGNTSDSAALAAADSLLSNK